MELRYRVGEGESCAASTKNIGAGGAFIITDAPLPARTVFTVLVAATAQLEALELIAEVRWVVKVLTPEHEAGMGVQFGDLDDARRALLEAHLAAVPKVSEYD